MRPARGQPDCRCAPPILSWFYIPIGESTGGVFVSGPGLPPGIAGTDAQRAAPEDAAR